MNNLVTTKKAADHFGVCQKTIRRWILEERLTATFTIGGHRRIDVSQIVNINDTPIPNKLIVTYARVSSRKQQTSLCNQENELKSYVVANYPTADCSAFTDVASGLNFKRSGLRALLELVMQGRVWKVVVAYRDRLCRFGFELFEWLMGKFNTKIVVLHSMSSNTPDSLAEDLLAVVTVFAARVHGMRKYKQAIEKELGDPPDKGQTGTNPQEPAERPEKRKRQRKVSTETARASQAEINDLATTEGIQRKKKSRKTKRYNHQTSLTTPNTSHQSSNTTRTSKE
jgi:putative resolvase